MNDDKFRVMILLSLQSALLGEVFSKMRCVTCSWSNDNLQVIAIVDGEIDDEDKESLECIHSELLAMLPDNFSVLIDSVRIDSPVEYSNKLLSCCVYKRREQ